MMEKTIDRKIEKVRIESSWRKARARKKIKNTTMIAKIDTKIIGGKNKDRKMTEK